MNNYFDNASTSFPKPAQVGRAMSEWLVECGGTYGRAASDRVLRSVAMVERCRDKLAAMIGASDKAEHLFFTQNATHASNAVLKGIDWRTGDRILVSSMEHNAVMRPLEYLRARSGVEYDVLPADEHGQIDVTALEKVDITDVKLVIINHISNVNGVVQPLDEIGRWTKANGLKFMVDTSQSIGYKEININNSNVDFLIFTGHKALYGPTGTGGMWIKEPDAIEPLMHGGTGSNSESFEMPIHYPDRMEGGTPNVAGIVGLLAAIENHPQTTKAAVHSWQDLQSFHARISSIPSIKVLSDINPIISLTSSKLQPSEIAAKLHSDYKIEVRSGLHCAPLAHRHLGTYPTGTVRISTSPYHSAEDLDRVAVALEKICT